MLRLRSVFTASALALATVSSVYCAPFSDEADDDMPSTPRPSPSQDATVTPADDGGADPADADAAVAPCAAHERRVDGVCRCAPGFAGAPGQCAWSGILQDPELVGQPADVWITDGGVLQTEDGGSMTFPRFGAVAQRVEWPTVSELGDLSLALRSETGAALGRLATEVTFDGTTASVMTDVTNLSTCLGERWLGQIGFLQFAGESRRPLAGSGPWWLTRAEILPDATCPRAGLVTNGDFEGTGGWQTSGVGGSYDFAPSHGVGQSTGARISTADLCETAALSNPISLPTRPGALEYAVRASSDMEFRVQLGLHERRRSATSLYETQRFCVPSGQRGLLATFAFTYGDSTGPCVAASRSLFIDDVRWVEDANCTESPGVVNADFAQTTLETWWPYFRTGATRTRVVEQTMELSLLSSCSALGVRSSVNVPVPAVGNGVRLGFRAQRLGAAADLSIEVGTAVRESRVSFAPTESWSDYGVCVLPEHFGGVVELLALWQGDLGGACTEQEHSVRLDDFVVRDDPNCPHP